MRELTINGRRFEIDRSDFYGRVTYRNIYTDDLYGTEIHRDICPEVLINQLIDYVEVLEARLARTDN